jgi:type IV pilus assembly protein PilV
MSTLSTHSLRRSAAAPGRGFVMLEALVGGLIFAIGVLGVVALQASMTQSQTIGKFRGDAVYLADELVGLIWSDSAANMASYATASCGSYTRCNDWKTKVANELPSGAPTVTVNTGTGQVDVTITWATRSGNQSYSTTTSISR